MNLATSATYFAYQTISSGFLILYRHTLTQTCVIEVLTRKYLHSDHYSMRGQIFSENNSPADQIFRKFWSPGPKFSPDQNFRDREIYVWQSCVEIKGYSVTSLSPRSKCRVAKLQFLVSLSSSLSSAFTGTFPL